MSIFMTIIMRITSYFGVVLMGWVGGCGGGEKKERRAGESTNTCGQSWQPSALSPPAAPQPPLSPSPPEYADIMQIFAGIILIPILSTFNACCRLPKSPR